MKCEECRLKEECPVYCGFCREYKSPKIGTCEVCHKENVPLVKHGNMKTGYWVCPDCAVACMY